jgi:broad specificity phosphatase PhoE
MGKINLYLIRHGETLLNRYQKMQGWADSPLTEPGKAVAIETGKKLANISFDRVYTSDSGRTVETAELILQQNQQYDNLVTQKTRELREIFFGSFEGEASDVIWEKMRREKGYDNVAEMLSKLTMEEVLNLFHSIDPLGHAENYQEFTNRIDKGLNIITNDAKNEEENVLVVSHGVVIMNLVNKFSKEPIGPIEIKNSSITRLEFLDNQFTLISYNQ